MRKGKYIYWQHVTLKNNQSINILFHFKVTLKFNIPVTLVYSDHMFVSLKLFI